MKYYLEGNSVSIMKRTGLLFLLFLVFLSTYAQMPLPKKPVPPRLVNDFTNTLTPEQVEALESKLIAYDDSTSNQVAVVIIKSTNDYPIEDMALGILREWQVGTEKNNNGVVILVAKDDRELWISTGYGLEGAIPDITAKNIIENTMLPQFREDNYYSGIDQGVNDIIRAAAGEYQGTGKKNTPKKGIGIGRIIFILIVLFFIFSGRGGKGGKGGGMASRKGYREFAGWWLLGNIMGGMSGRSGGGWSGGGGGFGGGGFGGFGGGSGGGGGAGGRW